MNDVTINRQNTTDNIGLGTTGNNNNIQGDRNQGAQGEDNRIKKGSHQVLKEEGGESHQEKDNPNTQEEDSPPITQEKNLNTPKSDRGVDLENRVLSIEKSLKKYQIACVICTTASMAFFFGVLLIKSNLPNEISLFISSLIVAFIGALATLVVVRNESQVREVKNEFSWNVEGVKNEFSRNLSEIERQMEKRIDNSLDSVHHIMEAIGYQAMAISYFDKAPAEALEYLMCALRHTNMATKVWEVVDGIIHTILMFVDDDRGNGIIIPPQKKREYYNILSRCNHGGKDKVLAFIKDSKDSPYIPIVEPNSSETGHPSKV